MTQSVSTPAPVSARFPIGSPPGWMPDPTHADIRRWWDGQHWSDETRAANPKPGRHAAPSDARRGVADVLGGVCQALVGIAVLAAGGALLYHLRMLNVVEVWRLQPTAAAGAPALTGEGSRVALAVLALNLLACAPTLVWVRVVHGAGRAGRRSTPVAVRAWWLGYLLAGALSVASSPLAGVTALASVRSLEVGTWLDIAAALLLVVGGLLLVALIGRVSALRGDEARAS